jgi:hypothetical protein
MEAAPHPYLSALAIHVGATIPTPTLTTITIVAAITIPTFTVTTHRVIGLAQFMEHRTRADMAEATARHQHEFVIQNSLVTEIANPHTAILISAGQVKIVAEEMEAKIAIVQAGLREHQEAI